MLPFSLTPLSPAISASTSSVLSSKASAQQGMHKNTHRAMCAFFAARNILNADLDRSHFAANRTVRREEGGGWWWWWWGAGRQVATKGKYTQMA